MNLLTDKAKNHALLDRFTASSIAQGVVQAQHGVDAVLISSAFVGGPFLSRKMYQESVVPYERRVTDAIKTTGVPVYTHTCGHIGDRLELRLRPARRGLIP